MILTVNPIPTEEQLQPILQLLTPEQASYVVWIFGAMGTAYVIYTTIIKPLMAASKTAKELLQTKLANEELKDKISTLTAEDIDNIANKTLSDAEVLLLKAEVLKLKTSMSLTSDPILQADIQMQINEIETKLAE